MLSHAGRPSANLHADTMEIAGCVAQTPGHVPDDCVPPQFYFNLNLNLARQTRTALLCLCSLT